MLAAPAAHADRAGGRARRGAGPGRPERRAELTGPLYRKLVSIDPELLMPGVGALPADSVGLAR